MVTISVTLHGTPHVPAPMLQALYRVNGRSTVEMRRAVAAGDPLYAAELFGPAHIDAVPRLEKTVAYLLDHGIGFALHESEDGRRDEISLETLSAILGDAAD